MFDSTELRIPRKQASWIAALLIFCFFIVFVVGYYLGKSSYAEAYVYTKATPHASVDRQDDRGGLSIRSVTPEPDLDEPEFIQIEKPALRQAQDDRGGVGEGAYVAQLVGYGTNKKAQAFVGRLAKRGIQSDLKKRVSTTSSGRKITWYQVVTKPHTDKKALQSLVDRIVKLEHIRNYRIVNHRR